jgi:hypothetical protein
MRFLDYKLKTQNMAFHADIEPGLETPLAPHDLEEIFLNTMINSIQAMAEGGFLRVIGKHREDKVHTDIRLPAAGGMDILKKSLKEQPATPVITGSHRGNMISPDWALLWICLSGLGLFDVQKGERSLFLEFVYGTAMIKRAGSNRPECSSGRR